jgi:predicted PurR-regulated permease PerM
MTPERTGPVRHSAAPLFILSLLATFTALYFARSFVLPLMFALLLSFLFDPLVRGLERIRVPRAFGAGIVLMIPILLFSAGISLLVAPANDLLERAPSVIWRLEGEIEELKRGLGRITATAEQVEELTTVGAEPQPTVKVDENPGVLLHWTQSFMAATVVTFVLMYFFLARGDRVGLAIASLWDDDSAIEQRQGVYRDIQRGVSVYLTMITMINVGLGCIVGLLLFVTGLSNAFFWGVMVCLLNFIPYVGAIIGVCAVAIASVLELKGQGNVLLPPLAYAFCTLIEGYFVTPAILGRRFTVSPLFMIIALTFWGWLWGGAGALLAVPLLVTFKIICSHVPRLKRVEALLDA